MSGPDFLLTMIPIAIGTVLAHSATSHLSNLQGFSRIVEIQRIIPSNLSRLVAPLVASVELLLMTGCLSLSLYVFSARQAAMTYASMSVFFVCCSAYLLRILVRGLVVPCGCSRNDARVGMAVIVRGAVLAVASACGAAVSLVEPPQGLSLDVPSLTALLGGLVFGLLAVTLPSLLSPSPNSHERASSAPGLSEPVKGEQVVV